MNMIERLKVREEGIAADVVDGEAVIINLNSGMYYSFDNVGALIWSLVEQGRPLADIADSIVRIHEVGDEQARQDLQTIAARLLEEELVSVDSGTTAPTGDLPAGGADRLPYVTPTLTKFDDMAELFALDPPLPELPAVERQGSS